MLVLLLSLSNILFGDLGTRVLTVALFGDMEDIGEPVMHLLDGLVEAEELSRVESNLLHKDNLFGVASGRTVSFCIRELVTLLMLLLEESEYLGEYLLTE